MLLTLTVAEAQLRRTFTRRGFDILDGMTITPKAGVNLFYGDLVDESRTSYSAGLLIDREMTRTLSLRFNVTAGQMKGEQMNPVYDLPYASFTNFYTDISIGGSYRPLNHLMGYFRERTLQPYFVGQVGLVYYSAEETWGPASELITPGAVDGQIWRQPSGIAPMISGGGGVSFWISPTISLNAEFTGFLPFSDQLDGHDVWYSSWPDGEAHDTAPYDVYYTATLGVSIMISDSPFRNDPRFNRRSYTKTRRFYQPKNTGPRRPGARRRFLFF